MSDLETERERDRRRCFPWEDRSSASLDLRRAAR